MLTAPGILTVPATGTLVMEVGDVKHLVYQLVLQMLPVTCTLSGILHHILLLPTVGCFAHVQPHALPSLMYVRLTCL